MKETPEANDELIAAQLAAMAHPVRLQILRWLAQHDACKCKDVVSAVPLAQSTVSQHLKILGEAGLIEMNRDGTASLYRLKGDALENLGRGIGTLVDECCSTACCDSKKSIRDREKSTIGC